MEAKNPRISHSEEVIVEYSIPRLYGRYRNYGVFASHTGDGKSGGIYSFSPKAVTDRNLHNDDEHRKRKNSL